MCEQGSKTAVSFPVTIWYSTETQSIHVVRRTDPAFTAEITAGPCDPARYQTLYTELLRAIEAGTANKAAPLN